VGGGKPAGTDNIPPFSETLPFHGSSAPFCINSAASLYNAVVTGETFSCGAVLMGVSHLHRILAGETISMFTSYRIVFRHDIARVGGLRCWYPLFHFCASAALPHLDRVQNQFDILKSKYQSTLMQCNCALVCQSPDQCTVGETQQQAFEYGK
jgi:hypothetical protein